MPAGIVLQQLAQLTVNGLITGTILALTGVGATLVFGIQRIANFAHGEYLTFAAYVALLLNTVFGQNLVVATLGAMAATALLALALHFAVLKPLSGPRPGRDVADHRRARPDGARRDLPRRRARASASSTSTRPPSSTSASSASLPGQAVALAHHRRGGARGRALPGAHDLGKSMRAVADNRDLAAVSGIDVERMGTYVWLLAGALCGIGGIMFAAVQGTFDPNLGFQVLFLIFTTVVLGGIGSAYGALVGGFVLGLAMELSTWSGFFGGLEARFKPVLAFVA